MRDYILWYLNIKLLAWGRRIGRYPPPAMEPLRFLAAAAGLVKMQPERYALLHNLIVEIRLPRVSAAILVGASLSVSGATYQTMFRNPLVSPGLLGVLAVDEMLKVLAEDGSGYHFFGKTMEWTPLRSKP